MKIIRKSRSTSSIGQAPPRLQATEPSLIALAWATLLTISCPARAAHFEVRDAMQRDLVQLSSDTNLEKITAISNAIAGSIDVDLKSLGAASKASFEIDLRQLDTTNTAKNDFVQKLLGVTDFPFARFNLDNWTPTRQKGGFPDGVAVTSKVEGTLELHGVKKSVSGTIALTFLKESELTKKRANGNLIRIAAKIEIPIADFLLSIPDSAKGRVAKSLQLVIDAVASDAAVPTIKQ